MNVPKSFVDLVYSKTENENYIGMGNPNAKILIIGREPAHDLKTEEGREAHHQDQELNRTNWKNLIEGRPVEGRCNPRRPFPDQKCCRRVVKYDNPDSPDRKIIYDNSGTASTWVWYQKLIYKLIDKDFQKDVVDFHDYCFHTDISSASAESLKTTNKDAKAKSVDERSKHLFNEEFFKQFPITILAIGTDVGKYVPLNWCEEVLGFPRGEVVYKPLVDSKGEEWMIWLNKDSKNHRILLHTYSLSQSSWEYIEKIRNLICEEGFSGNYYPDLD